VVRKYLDFTGSVLGGQGIGRYGSSQLPDVTVGTDGSLTPLQSIQFMLGLVGHATPDLDIYGYYGQEQVNSSFWSIAGTNGGFGNPLFVNNGCLLENQGSGTAGYNDAITGTTCTANVHRTQEFTAGFWQNLYNGKVGRFVFGAQYEYIRLSAFNGLPTGTGTPNQGLSPNNNVVMVSLRFYPGYPQLP